MRKIKPYLLLAISGLVLLCYIWSSSSDGSYPQSQRSSRHQSKVVASPEKNYTYDRESPYIFIGGVPRSGTTLMRAMLDAHPEVRCGEETRVIPRILGLRAQWKRSEKEWNRLNLAGVTNEVLSNAISSFIIEIMAGHGAAAPRLCNKDPFTMKSAVYLSEIFPKAKFVLMIRDGRATVHSIISRKVTITGFDLSDYGQCLKKWNDAISIMYDQCNQIADKCFKMYYEQLVLHPEQELKKLLEFLEIPWNDTVLHHEELIGKDISLSKVERSSDQVVKPVNMDALNKWVGQIPADVVRDMDSLAPMLRRLGYDPEANPPNYGKPDEIVAQKTEDVHKNGQLWYRRGVEVVNDPNRVDKPI
ncbi:unnamed protein product [Auanema sp. JU1783]|nr:unnamed protein product [Auanema sp. JU1783]